MYSYDDRIRAVELDIKLGKRIGPTIRQLGYPTKNALKGWYRAYQQRLELPVGYARREPKFSQASYIRWYNEKRIKISLGSLSPIEYRVSLGLAA
jgi:transposase InsO family protein